MVRNSINFFYNCKKNVDKLEFIIPHAFKIT